MSKVLAHWQKKTYYDFAQKGSGDIDHPGMVTLKSLVDNANSILDLGCGEGTRLNNIVQSNHKYAVGVDISQTAISRGRKQYKRLLFHQADVTKVDLKQTFDIVYSAFTLEHVQQPERLVNNALRHVSSGGRLVFMAPNFGAPNRRSPNSTQGKIKKLIQGFASDFSVTSKTLNWQKVSPKSDRYDEIDADALCEPYVLSLKKYIESRNVTVIHVSSLWQLEPWSFNIRKSLFKLLGLIGIYPFVYWGPQLLLVAKK